MRKMKLSTITIRVMSMLAIAAMFVVAGCGDDDDGGDPDPTMSVWDIVAERSELSGLEAELIAAGLNDDLASANNITLFAPSNAALNTLLNTLGIPDFSPVRDDVAEAVLAYHVATSVYMSGDLTAGTNIMTLQGEEIDVVAGPALSTGATSDSEIETANLEASNGVVHIVDVVLVPPTLGELIVQTLGTVAQPILLSENYSTLADAIQKADAGKDEEETILAALVGLEDVTVFAPINAVFEGAGITLETYTAEQWDAIIRGHAVAQTLAPLADTDDIPTVNAGVTVSTTAAVDPGFGTVQGSGNAEPIPVVADGTAASNGIVYPIGGVIL